MFAVNRREMKEDMLKDLRNGVTLICDRYAYSGVAYTAAKVIFHFWGKHIIRVLILNGVKLQIKE